MQSLAKPNTDLWTLERKFLGFRVWGLGLGVQGGAKTKDAKGSCKPACAKGIRLGV